MLDKQALCSDLGMHAIAGLGAWWKGSEGG
jgi:hypothetical protein